MKRIQNNRHLLISIIVGLVGAIVIALIIGIPTDVIENPYYMRMTPTTLLEPILLVLVAVLFGVYAGLLCYSYLSKKTCQPGAGSAGAGVVAGMFAIACPICISFLVWIFGTAVLMRYLDPIRPILGVLAVFLLAYAIRKTLNSIRHQTKRRNI